jgi:hypothetical protein
MRELQPDPLILSEVKRAELERFVRRQNTTQQNALRGRKHHSDGGYRQEEWPDGPRSGSQRRDGARLSQALDKLPVSEYSTDVPRPVRPAQITAEQTCQMIAMACQKLKGYPISQWRGREIADEVMVRGIIEQISPRRMPVKKGDLQPHLIRHLFEIEYLTDSRGIQINKQ